MSAWAHFAQIGVLSSPILHPQQFAGQGADGSVKVLELLGWSVLRRGLVGFVAVG